MSEESHAQTRVSGPLSRVPYYWPGIILALRVGFVAVTALTKACIRPLQGLEGSPPNNPYTSTLSLTLTEKRVQGHYSLLSKVDLVISRFHESRLGAPP